MAEPGRMLGSEKEDGLAEDDLREAVFRMMRYCATLALGML